MTFTLQADELFISRYDASVADILNN